MLQILRDYRQSEFSKSQGLKNEGGTMYGEGCVCLMINGDLQVRQEKDALYQGREMDPCNGGLTF